jgi:hypothetical protein
LLNAQDELHIKSINMLLALSRICQRFRVQTAVTQFLCSVKAEEMKHLVDCRNLLVLMYRYWERFHLALRYVLVEMKDHQ